MTEESGGGTDTFDAAAALGGATAGVVGAVRFFSSPKSLTATRTTGTFTQAWCGSSLGTTVTPGPGSTLTRSGRPAGSGWGVSMLIPIQRRGPAKGSVKI